MKNQVGDAQGFGGMLPIFAEAYQRVLGRTGDAVKRGDEAIKDLLDATQKGQVISAKILPLVEEIARRESEPGLWKMRESSNAERNRFWNLVEEGWQRFGEGGGEEGLSYFWIMMQDFGQWFKDNGRELGWYFKRLMVDLNVFKVGMSEFIDFAWNGASNDLTDIVKENWGIDLIAVRDRVIEIYESIKSGVIRILTSMGFIEDGSLLKGLNTKFGTFLTDLEKMFVHVEGMVASIARFLRAWDNFKNLPFQTKIGAILPTTAGNKELTELLNSAGAFIGHGVGMTADALSLQTNLLFGGASPKEASDTPVQPPRLGFSDETIPKVMNSLPSTTPSQVSTSPTTVNHVYSGTTTVKVEMDAELAKSLDPVAIEKKIVEVTTQQKQQEYRGLLSNAPNN